MIQILYLALVEPYSIHYTFHSTVKVSGFKHNEW
jgi:hypothetical protein